MYLDPEPREITRHFADVAGRLVHYRRAGSGPPLVLCHQSPTSSAELASEIVSFAGDFTVIAPDTPGYGWSDPLPDRHPAIADFADAVIALLDVLGAGRAGFYGAHTGAMIAADVARRHPERVTAAVLDGYVVLTPEEREDLLANYFRAPEPTPEGGHLPWLWMRIRDQTIFYPWYRKTAATRMRFDVPPAAALQPYLLDLMRAAHGGVPAYRAAFEYDAQAAAAEFAAPTYLLNYPADAIADHPERLARISPSVTREILPDPAALAARAVEVLKAHAEGDSPSPPPPKQPRRARFVEIGGVPTRLLTAGTGDPVLLLHEPGASLRQWATLMRHPGFSWLALDLPGHGASCAAPRVDGALVAALAGLVSDSGVQGVVGIGTSSWLAAAAAADAGVPSIAIDLTPDAEADATPDLTPQDHGGHLLLAWQAVRDSELFEPWCAPTLANSLHRAFDLDPARLTARTLDLLSASPHRARTAIEAAQILPTLIASRIGRGREDCGERIAGASGVAFARLPGDDTGWSEALAVHLREAIGS